MNAKQHERSRASRRRSARALVLSTAAAACLLAASLALIPALFPALGAATADLLRAVVGAGPVARLESASAWMRDNLYRSLPLSSGPGVSWSSGSGPQASLPIGGPAPILPKPRPVPPTPAAVLVTGPSATPTPSLNALSAPPSIGWQAYGPAPDGVPLMARALLMVDASRSYAGVALVRMDLQRLQLHIMAGYIEPAHPSGIDKLIPDLGMVAPPERAGLIAAFNGGFKAIHGHYGMMVNQVTLLEPVDGMATIAVYQDGQVRLGAWGRGVGPSPDMIAFRQNCPPLIEDGRINPALSTNAGKAWGITNNTDATWRTAVGLSQDGRFLIYAAGNGTTAQFLAEALQRAGADNAMQLDINQYYAHFVTYSSGANGLQASRLLEQMMDVPDLYLAPSVRDFFFVTLRP